jgi:hypothetical protein
LPIDSSFEDIVREHQAMVFRTLLRLTGSREHLEKRQSISRWNGYCAAS